MLGHHSGTAFEHRHEFCILHVQHRIPRVFYAVQGSENQIASVAELRVSLLSPLMFVGQITLKRTVNCAILLTKSDSRNFAHRD
ncbi:MAG: hypothetical protein JWM11_6084 [Planctomycetaceae bacterium]|nr:hypothetical protein [Planctomycetaceae bacterium]